MPRRSLRLAAALAALVSLSACDKWYYDVPSPDDLMHVIPWFDHMITVKSVWPYSRADIPRTTVPGTVPITGGEAEWDKTDYTNLVYGFDTLVANKLVNPTRTGATTSPTQHKGPETAQLPIGLDARGDTLYHTYCAVCHGQAGMGDGPVGRKVGAPSIVTDRARGFADGYLYSLVRYGRGVMPRYGDKIWDPMDRWAVVNYVRALQAQAQPAAPAAAPTATPTAAPAAAPKGTH